MQIVIFKKSRIQELKTLRNQYIQNQYFKKSINQDGNQTRNKKFEKSKYQDVENNSSRIRHIKSSRNQDVKKSRNQYFKTYRNHNFKTKKERGINESPKTKNQ